MFDFNIFQNGYTNLSVVSFDPEKDPLNHDPFYVEYVICFGNHGYYSSTEGRSDICEFERLGE